MRLRFAAAAVTLLSVCSFASVADAQITNVTGETQTPMPQSGRNYIQMLNEIVDPTTGSVSLRVSVPTAAGRKLSLPFAFAYDSSGAWFIEPDSALGMGAYNTSGPFAWGGWSYTVPQLGSVGQIFIPPNLPPLQNGGTGCYATTGYVFTDEQGGHHALGMAHVVAVSMDRKNHKRRHQGSGQKY